MLLGRTAKDVTRSRVLVLVQNLPVPFDRRVWQECLALASGGFDVTVISPADDRHPPTDEVVSGVRMIRYTSPPEARRSLGYFMEYGWSTIALIRHALKARRAGKFDAVHYCNPPDMLFLVGLLLKLVDGSRTVFDQHDLGPELVRAKKLKFSFFFVLVARWLERATFAASDFVVSTNESYRRIAETRGRKHPSQVAVVRSGPSASWSQLLETNAEWRNGREYLVAYLGVMGRQEGIEYLIAAADQLINMQQFDVQFVLVGSGPDAKRLEKIVARRGLSEHVAFAGRVPDKDLKEILASADLCVNPDEFNELNNLSTMNKILEYMALGRPTVQFDLLEGRYSAGESSLYAKPNDASDLAQCVATLLLDRELRESMGAKGRERFVSELAWERQAETLVQFYTDTVVRR